MIDPRTLMKKALDHLEILGPSSMEVPVAALILNSKDNLIACSFNKNILKHNALAHAELEAIESVCRFQNNSRLDGCTLVVTLEPCLMCAGAILNSRINKVIFGAWDEKAGACGSVWDVLRDGRSLNKVEVIGGVLENECAALLSHFFSQKR